MKLLGGYLEGYTIFHKFDARSKLFLLLIFSFCSIQINSYPTLLYLTSIMIVMLWCSRLPIGKLLKSIIPIIPIIIFTFFIYVLFSNGKSLLISIWIFNISIEGIRDGFFYISRVLLIMLLATTITLTTKPIYIKEAIQFFLLPLRFFNVPVKDISVAMTISMSFIPSILEEAIKIYNAQLSRAMQLNIRNFPKSMLAIIIPIVLNTFKKADNLAISMKLRGYNENSQDIVFKHLKWTKNDFLIIIIILIIVVGTYLLI